MTTEGARRVGWLGGSFDPVHEGHLAMARLARDRLGLERVLLVVAAQPPHKTHKVLAPAELRLRMVELAVADEPGVEACDIELRREEGPSYSMVTAEALRAELGPDVELFNVVGADTLADLPNWFRIDELCRLVTFCAVTRPGTPLDVEPMAAVGGPELVERLRAHLLEMEPHPASSTGIREALGRGETPPHLHPAVAAEIARRGLYGAAGLRDSDVSGADTEKP